MRKIVLTALIAALIILSAAGLVFSLTLSEGEVAFAAPATQARFLNMIVTETKVSLYDKFSGQGFQASGFVSFSNGVLTLESVVINNLSISTPIITSSGGDLEIRLVGTNRINNLDSNTYVIHQSVGNLTITGDTLLIDASTAIPIMVDAGNLSLLATEVKLSHYYSSIWVPSTSTINFAAGTKVTIFGGRRAICNEIGEEFLNLNIPAKCGIRVGSNENDNAVATSYGGQNYLFIFTLPELICANNVFDLYKPTRIFVTVLENGNSFMGITGLGQSTHYYYSSTTKIVELLEINFTGDRKVGQRILQFSFSSGPVNFTVEIVDTTPTTIVTLTPSSGYFDASRVDRVVTKINQPMKFSSVTGDITTEDYTFSSASGDFEFKTEFLQSLSNASYSFIFSFTGGAPNVTFILTVENSTNNDYTPPTGNDSNIAPTQATYDKYAASSNHKPISISLIFNGNSLERVRNGLVLIPSREIPRSGNIITISESYLGNLLVGEYTLSFEFSDGDPQVFFLKVVNTDPLPDNKSPFRDNPVPDGNLYNPGNPDNVGNETIVDGNGDTAALVIMAIFGTVGVASCVVWIILRKKRIV